MVRQRKHLIHLIQFVKTAIFSLFNFSSIITAMPRKYKYENVQNETNTAQQITNFLFSIRSREIQYDFQLVSLIVVYFFS